MKKLAVCIGLMSFLCLQAAAQVSGTASMNNVGYTLTDLRPADGVAPSITFGTGFQYSSAAIQFYDNNGVRLDSAYQEAFSAYGPASAALSSRSQAASSSVAGGSFAALGLQVSASAVPEDQWNDRVQAQAYSWLNEFVLSAGTAITFHGDAAATASTTWGAAGRTESSVAYGTMLLSAQNGSIPYVWIRDSASASAGSLFDPASGNWRGETVSLADRIEVTYANHGLTDIAMSLEILAGLVLDTFAAPVPEPATYAMLLAGLAVLSAAARRRKVE